MKSFKTLLFALLMSFVIPLSVSAQDFPPDPGGDPDDPVEVPIDGGLSLLLAAGVGYGVKKAHEARKNKNKSDVPETL